MEKTVDNTPEASNVSLVGFIFLIILNWVIIQREFYSSFEFVLQYLPFVFIFRRWKVYTMGKNRQIADNIPSQKLCIDDHESVDNIDEKLLLRGEVEMVMEKLGIFCDPDGDELQERLGLNEFAVLFEEEPSLEEVKEAFKMFDENGDGFIEARELKKVLSTLGFMVVSEVECERMIRTFDDNGDGRIDFNEFVKLVEKSFS